MAAQFTSATDLLYLASGMFARDPYSIVFVCRPDSDSGSSNPIVARSSDAGGSIRERLQLDSSGATNLLQVEAQPSGGASTGIALTLGAWAWLGLKRSGLTAYSYVAGLPGESIGFLDGGADTSASLAIGGTGAANAPVSIAEMIIYDVALSDAEFLAQNGVLAPVRATNIWARYRFQSGALTTDSSGNGHTLTSNGSPSFTPDPGAAVASAVVGNFWW